MSGTGWLGFDLDGTLAEYDGFKGAGIIGRPIPSMVKLIKGYIEGGVTCKIFTARVWSDGTAKRDKEAALARSAIQNWSLEHIGWILDVTCQKDYGMWALFDDRAIQVEKNTGRILGDPELVLETKTDP